MTIRTSEKAVTFRRPFFLGGFDDALLAGTYTVETDEELLEGISFPAYRRILAVIHLHATSDHPGQTRTLTLDPNELDAALARDRETGEDPGRPEERVVPKAGVAHRNVDLAQPQTDLPDDGGLER